MDRAEHFVQTTSALSAVCRVETNPNEIDRARAGSPSVVPLTPARGSHEQFLAATQPHLGAVWSVARRLTADPTSAEDAVQETFLRAYRSYSSQGRGDLRAWLVTICVNVIRSDHRRRQRRPAEDLQADPPARSIDGVDELVMIRLDRDLVRRGLEDLPADKRIAVTLVDIGGLTTREAAEVEGVPLGTMLSRVHRGRQHLALLLEREGLGSERR